MNKRPLPIITISCLFIASGVFGIAYHFGEINVQRPFEFDVIISLFIRLLAIAGGVFTLRGANWGRWLLLVWISYHVLISIVHPLSQLIVHCVLFVAVAYFLFCPQASAFFRHTNDDPEEQEKKGG